MIKKEPSEVADLLVSRKAEQGRDKDHLGKKFHLNMMNTFLRLVGTLIRFYLSVVSPIASSR